MKKTTACYKHFSVIILVVNLFSFMALDGAYANGEGEDAALFAGTQMSIGVTPGTHLLDPHRINASCDYTVISSLFEGLFVYDGRTGETKPGLAEAVTVNDAGDVYRITVRYATWTDGTRITAKTVVESWYRLLDPEVHSPFAWLASRFIRGAADYAVGKADKETVGIKAIEKNVVEIELVRPIAYVEKILAHHAFVVVPIHRISEHPEDWTSPALFTGNGPFMLHRFVPEERLICRKNPSYWDKESVSLEQIGFFFYEDDAEALRDYTEGSLDWNTVVGDDMPHNRTTSDQYRSAPYLSSLFVLINPEREPFSHKRFREVLASDINRAALVPPERTLMVESAETLIPEIENYPKGKPINPDSTNSEKPSLYSSGHRGPSIMFFQDQFFRTVGKNLQKEWNKQHGYELSTEEVSSQDYIRRLSSGAFDVVLMSWIAECNEPAMLLELFDSRNSWNLYDFKQEDFRALIDESHNEVNEQKRYSLLAKAEQILLSEYIVIPLFHYNSRNLIDSTRWIGWHHNPLDVHPLKEMKPAGSR